MSFLLHHYVARYIHVGNNPIVSGDENWKESRKQTTALATLQQIQARYRQGGGLCHVFATLATNI